LRHLGDPSSLSKIGGRSRLVLFDGQGPRFTVHPNLFEKISLERAVTGTAMLSVVLKGPGDTLRIPEMLYAEEWEGSEGSAPPLFGGRFRIDYWKADFDGTASELIIQARGPLGLLVDQAQQGVFSGELAEFVASTCSRSAPTEIVGLGTHPINVFVNMESTYAALRLLAVSLGFVIHEDSDAFSIQVSDLDHERQRIESKPLVELNESNMLGGSYTKGAPLKKRT
jgi:hypothetical protein